MNDRERFLETMRFGSPDRIPYWECAFWGETLERWVTEGLPEKVVRPGESGRDARETAFCDHFGFDRSFGTHFRGTVPVNIGLLPGFERKVLSEEDGVTTEQNTDGVVFRWSKTGHSTKQFLKFPVEDRSDFAEVKKRLDASTEGRFPEDWKEVALGRQEQGAPICLQVGGYYGFARNLMGLENLSIAFHGQQDLVEEIFEHRTAYLIPIIEKVLAEVRPDFADCKYVPV